MSYNPNDVRRPPVPRAVPDEPQPRHLSLELADRTTLLARLREVEAERDTLAETLDRVRGRCNELRAASMAARGLKRSCNEPGHWMMVKRGARRGRRKAPQPFRWPRQDYEAAIRAMAKPPDPFLGGLLKVGLFLLDCLLSPPPIKTLEEVFRPSRPLDPPQVH